MTVVLLPGMDGTGRLFKPFVKLLPQRVGVRIINYPGHVYLNYEQLAGRVRNELPAGEPFIIVAESYSGPIALTLAAHPVGDLLAVVLVSSFVSRPLGVLGAWVARLPLAAILRVRAPLWVLRWLLMDAWTPPEMLSEVRNAITDVRPDVLAARLKEALRVDRTDEIERCAVRLVCLVSTKDRLLSRRCIRAFNRLPQKAKVLPIPAPHFLLQCAPEAALAAITRVGLLDV